MKKNKLGENRVTIKIALVILIIMTVIWFRGFFSEINYWLYSIGFIYIFLFIYLKSWIEKESFKNILTKYITFMPFAHPIADWRKYEFQWATYIIIICNISIFFIINMAIPDLKEEILNKFMFLPRNPDWFDWFLTPFTSMFLHSNSLHLWGNMIFLWIFGTMVEKRIGWKRFILYYFITGIFGNYLCLAIYSIFFKIVYHGIGASGAIFGIMGVYLIRLYFKQMIFPIPILGFISLIFPVSLKIRMNSIIVMGLFLITELDSGVLKLQGYETRTAHWGHIGGMIAGIVLALGFRLQSDASKEKELDLHIKMIQKGETSKKADAFLKKELERDPNNNMLLLYLARMKSTKEPTRAGKKLYHELIKILLNQDQEKAVEIFLEYHNKYKSLLDPDLHFKMAFFLNKKRLIDKCLETLELVRYSDTVSKNIKQKASNLIIQIEKEGGYYVGNQFKYFKTKK